MTILKKKTFFSRLNSKIPIAFAKKKFFLNVNCSALDFLIALKLSGNVLNVCGKFEGHCLKTEIFITESIQNAKSINWILTFS